MSVLLTGSVFRPMDVVNGKSGRKVIKKRLASDREENISRVGGREVNASSAFDHRLREYHYHQSPLVQN